MDRVSRTILTGLAGGISWIAGMVIFFGPAQAILADPALQSEKFYGVMADPVNPPRMAEAFWNVPAGLMVLGFIYAFVFAVIERGLPGQTPTKRGLTFGLPGIRIGRLVFHRHETRLRRGSGKQIGGNQPAIAIGMIVRHPAFVDLRHHHPAPVQRPVAQRLQHGRR